MSALPIARTARRSLTGVLLLAALVATANGPSLSHAAPTADWSPRPTSPAAPRTITISASHPSFPRHLRAGLLALRVIGDGADDFAAGVSRANSGVSLSQIEAASAHATSLKGFLQLTRLVTFLGGTAVPPGGAATAILDLRRPGQYGLHLLQGDQGAGQDLLFAVTPAGGPPASPPHADVAVTLAGRRIVGIPRTLRAGATTFQLTNRDPWVHSLLVFRLAAGKTVRDVIAALADKRDAPWMHDAGDMNLLSPHQATWLTDTLRPGTYVAYCFLPDPTHGGEPFVAEGMITSFTVA